MPRVLSLCRGEKPALHGQIPGSDEHTACVGLHGGACATSAPRCRILYPRPSVCEGSSKEQLGNSTPPPAYVPRCTMLGSAKTRPRCPASRERRRSILVGTFSVGTFIFSRICFRSCDSAEDAALPTLLPRQFQIRLVEKRLAPLEGEYGQQQVAGGGDIRTRLVIVADPRACEAADLSLCVLYHPWTCAGGQWSGAERHVGMLLQWRDCKGPQRPGPRHPPPALSAAIATHAAAGDAQPALAHLWWPSQLSRAFRRRGCPQPPGGW